MASKSSIEWTDASWTPIRARNLKTGKIGWHCEHDTTGCEFCYSESMNKRLGTGLPFKPGHRKDIEIFLDEEMLLAPLRWKKPRMIFVCSMTDLFADFVKDEWLDKMFAVMACAGNHTFQVLTKRADRMRRYVAALTRERIRDAAYAPIHRCVQFEGRWLFDLPLPNVWLGVSAERQQEANERIPHLLATPAAVRFISAEPLLGPISLKRIKVADLGWQDVLEGWRDCKDYPGRENILDWIIVGGESGPNARPMHPDWARSLRDQCEAAGVAFFFKQWGVWEPWSKHPVLHDRALGPGAVTHNWPDGSHSIRVGKKAAGRLLDGREHNAMPPALPSALAGTQKKTNEAHP